MWLYNSEQCFGFRALVNCLKKEKIFQIFSALDGTPHLSYFWLKLILIRQRWYWKLLYMNIPICVICAILSSFFGFLDLNGKWGNLFDVRATDKCGNLSLSRVKFLDKKVAGEVFVSSIFDPRDPEYLLVQPDSNVDLLFS